MSELIDKLAGFQSEDEEAHWAARTVPLSDKIRRLEFRQRVLTEVCIALLKALAEEKK